MDFSTTRSLRSLEITEPTEKENKGVMLDCGYRVDVVVEDQVIVEIKSVAAITPVHEAQVMSYLKLSGCRYGLLINFNVKLLREGIRRFKI
jgi:GxxExxY protein